MRTLTSKQEARLEKKKKKAAALAEIIKLNDKDREMMKTSESGNFKSSNEDSTESQSNKNTTMISYHGNNNNYNIAAINNSGKSIDFYEGSSRKFGKEKRPNCDFESVKKRVRIITHEEGAGEGLNNRYHHSKNNQEHYMQQNSTKSYSNSGDITKPPELHLSLNPTNLTDEQYLQIKRELNERKRQSQHGPKIRLRYFGDCASLDVKNDDRTPLFITDIRNLLMTAVIGSGSPCSPSRWCHLERCSKLSQSVVLVVEGLSLYHFLSHESKFEETKKIFSHKLEVVMPSDKEGNIIEELAKVPLTSTQKEQLIDEFGSLEAAVELGNDPTFLVKSMFPVESSEEGKYAIGKYAYKEKEMVPRTSLLLSALQMVDEGYPIPLRGELANRYREYIFTKESYSKVTSESPMYALDCEMCRTTLGCNELTRISLVDEDLKPVYESLVRPSNKIVDYLTQYSGITPEMMLNATKTLQEVQQDLQTILPTDAILVGQSLNCDLHALKMMHPYVIDTSVIFNVSGQRRRKSKLQTLAKLFLGEAIQGDERGHDPIEDSRTSMKLTKLKLCKGLEFGDVILTGRKLANTIEKGKQLQQQQLSRMTADASLTMGNKKEITVATGTNAITSISSSSTAPNIFTQAVKCEKRTAIISSHEVNIDFDKVFNNNAVIITESDESRAKQKQQIDQQQQIQEIQSEDKEERQQYFINNTSNNFNNNSHKKRNVSNYCNNSNTKIKCYKIEGNKATVRKAQEMLSDHSLTIANISLSSQRLDIPRIDKTISNVDKWISKLWEKVAHNGLFMVLFGGSEGSTSGIAMMNIKRKLIVDVVSDNSVTLNV